MSLEDECDWLLTVLMYRAIGINIQEYVKSMYNLIVWILKYSSSVYMNIMECIMYFSKN